MLRLPGKQLYSCRYYYNGHTYHLDSRNSGTIFRCVKKNEYNCSAKIYVQSTENLAVDDMVLVGNHNHEGDNLLPLKEQLQRELEDQAGSTFEDLKSLYDRIIQREE